MASLNQYSGSWTRKTTVHLLKRTMFGAKPTDVNHFSSKTVSDAVDEILNFTTSAPNPPINHYQGYDNAGTPIVDPDGVNKGQTWINGTYADGSVNFHRGESIKSWWIKNMINQSPTIEEKLVLFWHHLFVTQLSSGGGATAAYRLFELFRTYSFKTLRTLMIEVTKNPQMMHYLNGYLNTKYSPDENYGRELQELFGVGKGPDSKYTESDVKEAARVLTGHSLDWTSQTYRFYDVYHDTNDKQFSAFYNNTKITGKSGVSGADELSDLVDMILATDECSKFIVRKIYKFFVNHQITASIETDIIAPLALIYKSNGYDLKPVLSKLFKSEHFFETNIMGCQIKSPMDLIIGFCRESNITQPLSTDIDTSHKFYSDLYYTAGIAQQMIGDPPNVAGWSAYYQVPQFYQIWVNSDTLPKRINFTTWMMYGGYNNAFSPINFAEQMNNPADPDALLDQALESMYIFDINSTTKFNIKNLILLNSLNLNSYWTTAWNDYKADPTNATKKAVVNSRLLNLVLYLTQSPHYQIC